MQRRFSLDPASCRHPIVRNVQAALQHEGVGVSAVQLDSTVFAAPSFASQLCLLQAKGYCTGKTSHSWTNKCMSTDVMHI